MKLKHLFSYSILLFLFSCGGRVKVIKHKDPFFTEKVEIQILDKAIVKLPFEPHSVKLYPVDIISVDWQKRQITIKGLDVGTARVLLLDEDKIKLGAIEVNIKGRD